MADVALTDIRYGGKGSYDNGVHNVDEPHKTIRAGEKIPAGAFDDAALQELRDTGAVGDEAQVNAPTPQSTSAALQSPEGEAMSATSSEPPTAAAAAGPPSEEDLAKQLDRDTNQVARGANAPKEADKAAKK